MKQIFLFYVVAMLILPFSISWSASTQPISVHDFLQNPPKVNLLYYQHDIKLPKVYFLKFYFDKLVDSIINSSKQFEDGELEDNYVYSDFSYFGTLDDVLKDFKETAQCDKVCDLVTDEEKASIYLYTMYFFAPINLVLRGNYNPDKEKIAPLVNSISSALKKIPAYSGQVYRAVAFGPYLKAYVPGKIVVEKAFTSTTLDYEYVKDYSVIMKINSKTGRIIRSLSSSPGEEEVLFERETKFKVISRKTINKQVFIDMEEI